MAEIAWSAEEMANLLVWSRIWARRLPICLCGGVIATTLIVVGAHLSADESKQNIIPVGLQGVLPESAPDSLKAEAMEGLGPNWKEWAQQTEKVVQSFYESSQKDLVTQTQALNELKGRLVTVEAALADPTYVSIRKPLSELRGHLGLRVDLCQAILTTASFPAQQQTGELDRKVERAEVRLNELEQFLRGFRGGDAWLPFIQAEQLRKSFAAPRNAETIAMACKDTLAILIDGQEDANTVQAEFMSRPAFKELTSALRGLGTVAVSMAENVDPNKQLRTQLAALVTAVEDYRSDHTAVSALALREAFDNVRTLSADQGDVLSSALRRHMLNYNLRIHASEDFLNRLMETSQCEQGPVVDCILGAAVSGWQTTNSTVRLDLKPSSQTIMFSLNVQGDIQSNTQGVTKLATVHTLGNHHFSAAKEIQFDGDRFYTSPATIAVNARNQTCGAQSNCNLPILRRIISNIAYNTAVEKTGESEAIAASRVRERVLPQLDSAVNGSFSEASDKLQNGLFAGLRQTGLFPDARAMSSDETQLRYFSRVMGPDEIGGSVPADALTETPQGTARLLLHESAVNNSMARMGLDGKTVEQTELIAHIEEFLTRALNRPFKFEAATKDAQERAAYDEKKVSEGDEPIRKLTLAPEGALQIQAENDELKVLVKAAFRKNEDEELTYQTVTIPIMFEVSGNQIITKRGTVSVRGAGVAKAGVIRKKIEEALGDRTVSGEFQLEGANKRKMTAVVQSIDIANGWISVLVK